MEPGRGGGAGLTETLVGHLGYVGIALILVLGGLGLPVPEEAPIILAAILTRSGKMWAIPALVACLSGVLLGDFIVYFLGYFYGEKVLSLPLTRKFLTRAREAQMKGYFHRHGVKILILGRFAVGFRTAAYLTAGILKLPPLKLFLIDLCAASLSTFLMFGLGYVFAHQIQSNFDRLKLWTLAIAALTVGAWLLHRYYKARMRAGLLVGPRVLEESDDVPLPPDDLHAHSGEIRAITPFEQPEAAREPEPVPEPVAVAAPDPAPAVVSGERGNGALVVVAAPVSLASADASGSAAEPISSEVRLDVDRPRFDGPRT